MLTKLGLPESSYILAVSEPSPYNVFVHSLGLPFMERFYNVFDATNPNDLQIGFAPNANYMKVYNSV